MANITLKQQEFINEYLIDLNATRAYKATYKSCKREESASVNASKLLRNAKVSRYLKERQQERQQRTEITQDMVIRELASVGFANGTDFAQVIEKTHINAFTGEEEAYTTVEIKLTADVPADKQKAITSIKQGKDGIEIKTADKVKALELLGKHLGMFEDKLKISETIPTVIVENLEANDE